MLERSFSTTPAPVMTLAEARVAVVGMGYVGLPLAVEFAKQRFVMGFDINKTRVEKLRSGVDSNWEITDSDLAAAKGLRLSCDPGDLAECNVYIIAVPTPVDQNRRPNLEPLLAATRDVGMILKRGDVVIYESTVFPGATEQYCVPVLERLSGMSINQDFHVGYSPERVSPGDKSRSLTSITKVTSGSTPEAADFVDALYRTIITAGTFKAASIKVAEAAKIVENTQRDVNIALMNELSIVFSHLGIDTAEVLDAASTKWNFSRLEPGLVGGHCIGIDPYYLLHRASVAGYVPNIIRVARETNDAMARHAAGLLVRLFESRHLAVVGARVLVLGTTFKPDCRDARNSKVVDLVRELQAHGMLVDVTDCLADPHDVAMKLGIGLLSDLPPEGADYDAIILAVPHREYVASGAGAIHARLRRDGVFFDLKGVFERHYSDLRL